MTRSPTEALTAESPPRTRATVPGPGERLLEIVATVSCDSDLHGYTGENGWRHPRSGRSSTAIDPGLRNTSARIGSDLSLT
ncbi:hypothetical protein ACWDKQ_08535 [Saccharopolyspora sp. NPDC000995]